MKNIILISLIFALISSCKRNSDPNPDAKYTSNNVIVVSGDFMKTSLFAVDSSSIIFLSDGAGVDKIGKGTILVSEISEKAPYGFLRQVNSTTIANGKLTCQTSQASLTDAIKDGQLSFNKSFIDADIVSTDSSGTRFSQLRTQLESFTTSFNKTINGVKLNGELTIEPTLNFELKIESSVLKKFEVSTDIKVTTKIRGEVQAVLEVSTEPILLADYKLKPIVAWIDFVPIVIVPHLIVTTGVNGKITAKMTMNAESSVNLTLGRKYDGKTWDGISKVQYSGFKSRFEYAKSTLLVTWLKGNCEFRFYGSKDIHVSLASTLTLIGELKAGDHCGTLDWGINLTGKILAKILDETLLDYSGEILADTYPLYRGPSDSNQHVMVGDTAFGGIVFYVEPNGIHGMVLPMPMLLPTFTATWWPTIATYATPGKLNIPTATYIGSGQSNTKQLISSGETKPYVAGICNNLVVNDCYDDWYLPSLDELMMIYINRVKLPPINVKGIFYSSSLEDLNNKGLAFKNRAVDFTTGKEVVGNLIALESGQRINWPVSFIPIRIF